jgi:hypothetical protein
VRYLFLEKRSDHDLIKVSDLTHGETKLNLLCLLENLLHDILVDSVVSKELKITTRSLRIGRILFQNITILYNNGYSNYYVLPRDWKGEKWTIP